MSPSTELVVAFSVPDPRATQTSPTPTPARPGKTASEMWPNMISTAAPVRVRSAPNSRSATQAPRIALR